MTLTKRSFTLDLIRIRATFFLRKILGMFSGSFHLISIGILTAPYPWIPPTSIAYLPIICLLFDKLMNLDEDIKKISSTYHAWRGEKDTGDYEDVPGFCKSATREEIKSHSFVLTPGRYVGAEDLEDEDEPFEEKMQRLTEILEGQFKQSSRLELAIRKNLREIGYGG